MSIIQQEKYKSEKNEKKEVTIYFQLFNSGKSVDCLVIERQIQRTNCVPQTGIMKRTVKKER